jgi:hypothetical protein
MVRSRRPNEQVPCLPSLPSREQDALSRAERGRNKEDGDGLPARRRRCGRRARPCPPKLARDLVAPTASDATALRVGPQAAGAWPQDLPDPWFQEPEDARLQMLLSENPPVSPAASRVSAESRVSAPILPPTVAHICSPARRPALPKPPASDTSYIGPEASTWVIRPSSSSLRLPLSRSPVPRLRPSVR